MHYESWVLDKNDHLLRVVSPPEESHFQSPKSQTRHSEPQNRNPKPETRNPESQILNPNP